ncbi:hypothetical protein H8959_007115 [Pygathrix nigripes]
MSLLGRRPPPVLSVRPQGAAHSGRPERLRWMKKGWLLAQAAGSEITGSHLAAKCSPKLGTGRHQHLNRLDPAVKGDAAPRRTAPSAVQEPRSAEGNALPKSWALATQERATSVGAADRRA